MTQNSTVTLVERLHKRTLEGRLIWEETSRDDTLQVSFPNHVVQISERASREDFVGPNYVIRVLGPEGDILEEMSDEDIAKLIEDGDDVYQIMRDTYVVGRRTAKGVEGAIREILEALGDDSQAASAPMDDDDIPF